MIKKKRNLYGCMKEKRMRNKNGARSKKCCDREVNGGRS